MKTVEIISLVADIIFKISVVASIIYLHLIICELREDRASDVSCQLCLYHELRKKIERLENEFREKNEKNKKRN